MSHFGKISQTAWGLPTSHYLHGSRGDSSYPLAYNEPSGPQSLPQGPISYNLPCYLALGRQVNRNFLGEAGVVVHICIPASEVADQEGLQGQWWPYSKFEASWSCMKPC